MARAATGRRIESEALVEGFDVPSNHDVVAHAIPGSQADTVRLRKTAVAQHSTKAAQVWKPPSTHLHANDQNVGRFRNLPQLSRAHIPAAGWCYEN